jgi:hypothetical protein
MEFTETDGTPKVRIVGRVASVHPATEVRLEGAHLAFTTTEWFGDGDIKVTWAMSVAGGKITGRQKRADGVDGEIAGVPAPALKRKTPAAWSKPEPIFNGKDLTGWEPDDPSQNHWKAQNGELVNEKAALRRNPAGWLMDGAIRYTLQFEEQRLDEDSGMAGLPGVSERDQ